MLNRAKVSNLHYSRTIRIESRDLINERSFEGLEEILERVGKKVTTDIEPNYRYRSRYVHGGMAPKYGINSIWFNNYKKHVSLSAPYPTTPAIFINKITTLKNMELFSAQKNGIFNTNGNI